MTGAAGGAARAVLLGFACGLVAACGSGAESGGEPTLGPPRPVTTGADIVLPLDAKRQPPSEQLAIQRAVWRLTRDCVLRFGARYTVAEADVVAAATAGPRFEHSNERRYGIIDAVSAAAHGYELPPQKRPLPAGGSGWDPSEMEKLLVRGPAPTPSPGAPGTPVTPGTSESQPLDTAGRPLPAGGCLTEANRRIAEGVAAPRDENIVDLLQGDSFERSQQDSRVRAAMRRWSDCMKRSGHAYRTVWEANDRDWPDPVGAQEIAAANADVACKRESDLPSVWLRVETAYQRRAIGRWADDLAAVERYARVTGRNAASVLAGG